jgi:hypothetical protein
MLNHLDDLLRQLFINQASGVNLDRVGFQPPDQEWRTYVTGLGEGNALNVYLVELRENRQLRSNERVRRFEDGWVREEPLPTRMDCYYLISAWSSAKDSQQVQATRDEHSLLYDATAALLDAAPLNGARVYGLPMSDSPWPPEFRRFWESDLPTAILPIETFPKYAEFWGTMGQIHPWKPAIYLVVTVPVVSREIVVAGPPVTTLSAEYRQAGQPETTVAWLQIGGYVLDATVDPAVPVAKAWIRLEKPGGEPLQTTETDALGRFTFHKLRPGDYQLNWRAAGHPIPLAPHAITVPSPTGEYDLRFEQP